MYLLPRGSTFHTTTLPNSRRECGIHPERIPPSLRPANYCDTEYVGNDVLREIAEDCYRSTRFPFATIDGDYLETISWLRQTDQHGIHRGKLIDKVAIYIHEHEGFSAKYLEKFFGSQAGYLKCTSIQLRLSIVDEEYDGWSEDSDGADLEVFMNDSRLVNYIRKLFPMIQGLSSAGHTITIFCQDSESPYAFYEFDAPKTLNFSVDEYRRSRKLVRWSLKMMVTYYALT
jgi:hypothetical protein